MTLDEETRQRIMAFADGQLAGEERERVEKIIAENADAKSFLDQVRRLDSALRGVLPEEPDDAEWASVWLRVRGQAASAPERKVLRPWWAVPVATAAVAALVFAVALRLLSPGTGGPGGETHVVEANGGRGTINGEPLGSTTEILADSDTIILDFPKESGTIIWTVTDDSGAVPVAL